MTTIDQLSDALVKADAAGDAESARAFAGEIRRMQSEQSQEPTQPKEKSGVMQTIGNIGAGALRGAGSIGATLLSPLDAAARAVGVENSFIGRKDRREVMDEALKDMGAETDSIGYGAGKIGAEIAGTAGAGGLLAKVAAAVPGVAKAAPALIEALRTGGMSAGAGAINPLTSRLIGGAATGGAMAGMTNPDEAGTGAAIGAALPAVGAILKGGGTLARKAIGGTTGVGEEALIQALRAGKEGGETAKSFTSAMRGESSMDDVLAMAKQNLDAMGKQKQAAYKEGMAGIKADKAVLDMGDINKSVNDAIGMATYKGQVKNEKAATALGEIKQEVDNWMRLAPDEYHTPEGLDALKQKVGGILEAIPFEQKTARSAAGKVYDSIKSEISKQAPEYSKVMKEYGSASDAIKEIERALSIGNKAAADTSMRKLQSLMRNNVNTSYGYREQLAKQLQEAGGQDMMPALAGQALSDAMPRGMQRALSGSGTAGLALTGNIPAGIALGAVSSPRLMGEALYGLGKAQGAINPKVIDALRQTAYKGAPIVGSQ